MICETSHRNVEDLKSVIIRVWEAIGHMDDIDSFCFLRDCFSSDNRSKSRFEKLRISAFQ